MRLAQVGVDEEGHGQVSLLAQLCQSPKVGAEHAVDVNPQDHD